MKKYHKSINNLAPQIPHSGGPPRAGIREGLNRRAIGVYFAPLWIVRGMFIGKRAVRLGIPRLASQ